MDAETVTHRCPNCGGPLLYDPKKQKFCCEYCQSEFTLEELNQNTVEDSAASEIEKSEHPLESMSSPIDKSKLASSDTDLELFTCPSCGAELVTEGTTAATFCYYCHNPVVLSGRVSGEFLPEKIIPFAVEKEKAVTAFLDWTRKKWFIPKDFFDKNQIEKLTGVYFPYWLVDSQIQGSLDAKANKIRIWRVGDIEYTETKKYAVTRKGIVSFSDFMKNALKKNISKEMIHSIQPFDLTQSVNFSSHYLSGFQAEKRDIEYLDLSTEIQQELKQHSEQLLRETIKGYTNVYNVHSQFSITDEENQYVLLPVWLLTYRKKNDPDKVYYYAMNGQTGKVSGVLPINYWKVGGFTAAIGLIVTLLALLGGYFL